MGAAPLLMSADGGLLHADTGALAADVSPLAIAADGEVAIVGLAVVLVTAAVAVGGAGETTETDTCGEVMGAVDDRFGEDWLAGDECGDTEGGDAAL